MKDTTKHCVINGVIVLFGVLSVSMITDMAHAEKEIKPPKIETPATTREEIVTGVCTFGDCPVATAATPTLPPTTEPLTTVNLAKPSQNLTTAESAGNKGSRGNSEPGTPITSQNVETTLPKEAVADSATTEPETEPLTDEPVSETYTLTEPVTDSNDHGYIGTFWITGYTAEEGFPEGSETASGYGVRPGYCAMNADQRRSQGISYGDQIYVEGFGTYTVMDSGCDWGVVDIWVYTNAEAYSITGNYDVYIV